MLDYCCDIDGGDGGTVFIVLEYCFGYDGGDGVVLLC